MNKKNKRLRRIINYRYKINKLELIRLVVHKTSKNIYAQIIHFINSKVIISASTLEKKIKKKLNNKTGNKKAAKEIGTIIANRSIKKGIKKVSFDRSGFKYHGRIKSLGDSARKAGLKF